MPIVTGHYTLDLTKLPVKAPALRIRFALQLVNHKNVLLMLYPNAEPSFEPSYARYVAIERSRDRRRPRARAWPTCDHGPIFDFQKQEELERKPYKGLRMDRLIGRYINSPVNTRKRLSRSDIDSRKEIPIVIDQKTLRHMESLGR